MYIVIRIVRTPSPLLRLQLYYYKSAESYSRIVFQEQNRILFYVTTTGPIHCCRHATIVAFDFDTNTYRLISFQQYVPR